MKLLWRAYERLAMLLGLGGLAVACLGWLPFALVLHPFLSRQRACHLGRRAIQRGFRGYVWFLEHCCACRFDLTALDSLPAAGPLAAGGLLQLMMMLTVRGWWRARQPQRYPFVIAWRWRPPISA